MEHTGRAKAAEFLAIVEGLFDQRVMEEYILGMPEEMKAEIAEAARQNGAPLIDSLCINLLMQMLVIKSTQMGASPDLVAGAVRMMAMIEFISAQLPDDK